MVFHSALGDPVKVLNKLQGSVLVIPSVTIGNIPQLAIDLLIHNLGLEQVGYLDDSLLFPFVSAVDYTGDARPAGVSTALEVYHSATHKLTVLQQRSPVLPNCSGEFLRKLIVPFVNSVGFAEVLLLHSKDAGLIDIANGGTTKRYEAWSNSLSLRLGLLDIGEKSDMRVLGEAVEISKFAHAVVRLLDEPDLRQVGESQETVSQYANSIPVSGSDSNASLHKTSDSSVPATVLSEYVYEGDNFGDAEDLTNKIAALLKIENKAWIRPRSWLGVYGDRPTPMGSDVGIYS